MGVCVLETHELEGLLNHTSTQTPTHTHTRARVYNEWSGEERAEGGVRAEGSREKRRATDDEAEKRERETRGGSNEVALKPSLLFRDSLMRLASAKSAVLLPRPGKQSQWLTMELTLEMRVAIVV